MLMMDRIMEVIAVPNRSLGFFLTVFFLTGAAGGAAALTVLPD
jgi:hypothetical protein